MRKECYHKKSGDLCRNRKLKSIDSNCVQLKPIQFQLSPLPVADPICSVVCFLSGFMAAAAVVDIIATVDCAACGNN